MSSKVLERSDRNRVLAGVFSGLAEYLNVDVNLLRLAGIILLVVAPILMVIIYTIAGPLIPRRGGVSLLAQPTEISVLGPTLTGLVLILVGAALMSGWSWLFFTRTFGLTTLAGLAIAVIGAVILVQELKKI
jgi:phage shock protein PspC (stress-responsive transcriptional regulator)